jgi:hypothetical protein
VQALPFNYISHEVGDSAGRFDGLWQSSGSLDMGREKYLTENPFRVLGVGSNLTQREVSRRASGMAQSAAVGLVAEPPFEEEFGPTDFTSLSASIRSMATDGVRRTVYRLLWPLGEASIAILKEGGTLSKKDLPPDEFQHVLFLASWYEFLQSGAAEEAAEAMKLWEEFAWMSSKRIVDGGPNAEKVALLLKRYGPASPVSDPIGSICDRLIDALIEDDGLDLNQAANQVSLATDTVTGYVLNRVSLEAERLWTGGRRQQAVTLVRTVLESGYGDDDIARGLTPIVATGDRMAHSIDELIQTLPDYEYGASPPTTPEAVKHLGELSEALSTHHPSAGLWADKVLDWNSAVVSKMRSTALTLNSEKQNAKALSVIEMALRVARDPKWKSKLDDDAQKIGGERLLRRYPTARKRSKPPNSERNWVCIVR